MKKIISVLLILSMTTMLVLPCLASDKSEFDEKAFLEELIDSEYILSDEEIIEAYKEPGLAYSLENFVKNGSTAVIPLYFSMSLPDNLKLSEGRSAYISFDKTKEILGEYIDFDSGLIANMTYAAECFLKGYCRILIYVIIDPEVYSLTRLEYEYLRMKLFYGMTRMLEEKRGDDIIYVAGGLELMYDDNSNVVGDANFDGVFNITDLLSVRKYILGMGRIHLTCGDVSNDGEIGMLDVLLMRKKLLGIEE